MDVCFNIDSKPGDILNLVSDRGTGTVLHAVKHEESAFCVLGPCDLVFAVLVTRLS